MRTAADRIVTVFGGTGFLGCRVVRHLRSRGFAVRVASRHPDRARQCFHEEANGLHAVAADIHDEPSVASAVTGAFAVVNAVSLYAEHGRDTFHAVHVEGARRMASQAQAARVERFVQVSGIGANPASPSLYIRKRGEGEAAVRTAFTGAIVARPAVMFGPDDAFLNTLLSLLRKLPVYPMFGDGCTRLQPAAAEDVAEAIARSLEPEQTEGAIYELGGPQIYTYAELLRAVAREAGQSPILMPVPFAAWHALAFAAEMLPKAPLARNQVELMQIDTVASPDLPGLGTLGIVPTPLEWVCREILAKH